MKRLVYKTVENMTMEFSEKNIEMTKMMAKIEQYEIENQNLVRMLETQKSEFDLEEEQQFSQQQEAEDMEEEQHQQFNQQQEEEDSEEERQQQENFENSDLFNENVEEWEEYPN